MKKQCSGFSVCTYMARKVELSLKMNVTTLVGLMIALAWMGTFACAHSMIEGTNIRDTDDNRAIIEVLFKLRDAMQARDVNAVMALVSPDYFEDNGTPNQQDDYGAEELQNHILPKSFSVAKEMHVTFDVHAVTVEEEHAFADIRYHSRAFLELPAGSKWDSHKDFNRVKFERKNEVWLIVAGL